MNLDLLPQLRQQFGERVAVAEKRVGVYQVSLPLYHEDGDAVDLYLEPAKAPGMWRVFDAGMTLQRLSYTIEEMTPAREKVLARMLSEAGVQEQDGDLSIEVPPASLVPALLQLAQAEARVGAIRHFRREIVAGLFHEELDELISTLLRRYSPQKAYLPLEHRDDLEVDWKLTVGSRPFFVFGVRDQAKARLATIACQAFQLQKLSFRSAIVHEAMLELPKKDQTRLTSAADKQFPNLADFRENAVPYFEREAA